MKELLQAVEQKCDNLEKLIYSELQHKSSLEMADIQLFLFFCIILHPHMYESMNAIGI